MKTEKILISASALSGSVTNPMGHPIGEKLPGPRACRRVGGGGGPNGPSRTGEFLKLDPAAVRQGTGLMENSDDDQENSGGG